MLQAPTTSAEVSYVAEQIEKVRADLSELRSVLDYCVGPTFLTTVGQMDEQLRACHLILLRTQRRCDDEC